MYISKEKVLKNFMKDLLSFKWPWATDVQIEAVLELHNLGFIFHDIHMGTHQIRMVDNVTGISVFTVGQDGIVTEDCSSSR